MFQDFSATALANGQAERAASAALQEFTELIDRYPMLSDAQLARSRNPHRELSALDVALMISDEDIGPKLDRFFTDHRSAIRTPFRQYAVLVAIAVAAVAIVGWALAVAT